MLSAPDARTRRCLQQSSGQAVWPKIEWRVESGRTAPCHACLNLNRRGGCGPVPGGTDSVDLPLILTPTGAMRTRANCKRWLYALTLVVAICPSAWARSGDGKEALPKSISIREAFAAANGISSDGTRYTMQPGSAARVDINGEILLAVPLMAEASKEYTVTVNSFVVRLGRDEWVLYYPLVSLVSADYEVYQTLKPHFEFNFSGNALSNEFQIPAGASYLLVHSSAEFFRSDFTGTTSRRGSWGSSKSAAVVAAGGVIGGAVVMSLAQGKERKFHFGEVGLIVIARD